jgi:ribonuclease VapC
MIVDSSALVAIVVEEPGYQIYIDQIAHSDQAHECGLLSRNELGRESSEGTGRIAILREFVRLADIEIVSFTAKQAELAFNAHLRFGKGTGQPAQLNILDCCTYAVAKEFGEPLLFKGDNFSQTDVMKAELI